MTGSLMRSRFLFRNASDTTRCRAVLQHRVSHTGILDRLAASPHSLRVGESGDRYGNHSVESALSSPKRSVLWKFAAIVVNEQAEN
jgi:hypothetical protein